MPSQEVLTALDKLHQELEGLEPAIKHIETAQEVTRIVKAIPEKHVAFLESLKVDNDKHQDSLSRQFSTKLSELSNETDNLMTTARGTLKQIEGKTEEVSNLRHQIANYHDKVERINFPDRLDKLDATVSGVMAAIQSTQSRLDNIERNLVDRMVEVSNGQKEHSKLLAQAGNRNFIFHLVTLVIVVGLLVVVIMN